MAPGEPGFCHSEQAGPRPNSPCPKNSVRPDWVRRPEEREQFFGSRAASAHWEKLVMKRQGLQLNRGSVPSGQVGKTLLQWQAAQAMAGIDDAVVHRSHLAR